MTIEKEPVEIYSGTSWEAEMIKSLLANEGVEGFLINNSGTVFPFEITESGTAAVKVMIFDADYQSAKAIVESYLANKSDSEN